MPPISEEINRIAENISRMKIRGAGKIARYAAEALLLTAKRSTTRNTAALVGELEASAKLLLSTRPTAVSLPNSIRYVMFRVREAEKRNVEVEVLRSLAIQAAAEFIRNSERAVELIGEIGARRIENGDLVMTHCNSSAVTAVLRTALKRGKNFKVFVCETRPRFQGRITAKTLSDLGIQTSLIVDGAARFFMAKVDKTIVGADAVAASGAVVNKIGTSMVALTAQESRVPFFVAAETYKFSPETVLGQTVEIEERDSSEILSKGALRRMPKIKVRNPAFDVTPPGYIDLIITEKGVIPPQASIMMIQQEFGSMKAADLMEYQTHRSTGERESRRKNT